MAIPSNRNAVILDAKAAAFGAAVNSVLDGKSAEDASASMVRAIHDASVHLGATCVGIVGLDDALSEDGEDGASDGANKALALALRAKALSRA